MSNTMWLGLAVCVGWLVIGGLMWHQQRQHETLARKLDELEKKHQA